MIFRNFMTPGIKDLSFSIVFKLRAISAYDFLLTAHKPAGWSLLTPFKMFEDSTLWTGMRLNSGKIFGWKLRSKGTVERPKILCTVFSPKKVSMKERKELSEIVACMLGTKEDVRVLYNKSHGVQV